MFVILIVLSLVTSTGCYETHHRSDTGVRDSATDTEVRDSATDTGEDSTVPPPPGDCRPGEIIRCGERGEGFRACSPAGNWCRCNAEYDTGSPGGWNGCRASGVWVCEELVADAPCYWENHPRCQRNTDCDGAHYACNADCPEPGPADRCMCEGSGAAGWAGCSGDGCGVCDTVLEEYPCYFRHNYACTQVECSTGGGGLGCDDSLCPAPMDADRGEG